MPDSSQLSSRSNTLRSSTLLSMALRSMALLVAGSLMALAACTVEHARTAADSAHAAHADTARAHTARADTTHASTVLPPVAPSTVQPASRSATGSAADTTAWRASAQRVGPVTFGMTIAAAARAGGGTVAHPPGGSCGFTSLRAAPHGARFMVSYDTVVRVDVDSATVPTDAGARVGMREDSVQHLYANKLRVTPHKYVRGGHYLIFVPGAPADTMHQLIFETDGDRVTRYRAGMAPYVGYVEGCG